MHEEIREPIQPWMTSEQMAKAVAELKRFAAKLDELEALLVRTTRKEGREASMLGWQERTYGKPSFQSLVENPARNKIFHRMIGNANREER